MQATNNNQIEAKPCLVQTAQGFTVSYNGKFLYSKYNPQKSIIQIIQNLEILPQTLFLCISPVLPYGLKELSQKLTQDCLILGCELDTELGAFEKEQIQSYENINNFSFLTKEEMLNLGPILTKPHYKLESGFILPPAGSFRRVIRLDFSAGASLFNEVYESIHANAVNALMTFWANRVTLVKFGRKYCTNFFKNLSVLSQTVPIQKYFGSIEKPVIVFGAGESAQDGIKHIKENSKDDYYILCADTALQPLLANNITPDGVFIEEAQNIICKCFIGTQASDIHIFAGLSSVHSITRYFKPEQISFFTTEFTQANFIDRFDQDGILPPKNQPFGSVGITAFYYANIFRKNNSVPVYTYGLDFAYSAGRTHTKGAMADNERFQNSNRIKPDTNFAAAFCEPAFKKNEKMYTTPIMARYDAIMQALRQTHEPQNKRQGFWTNRRVSEPVEGSDKISLTLKQEAQDLQGLKDLLTGEKPLSTDQLEKEITQLVSDREYLYLHFPDGHKFTYTQSFLNRIRIEIDYYLKFIH